MSRMSPGVVMILAGLFFLPGAALAQPVLVQRCTIDSVDPAQAEARLKWMRKCALTKAPPIWEPAPAGYLQDYMESNLGPGMYTGVVDMDLGINATVVNKLYMSGATSQTLDWLGFYEWYRSPTRKKVRPYYPTYSSTYDITNPSNQQLFPHPTLANCNLYFDRNGTQPAAPSQAFFLNGYCESGAASLASGVPITVAGGTGSTQYHSLNVPAGATRVIFETSGGTGDVDLYVRYGTLPETGAYDCRPLRSGNTETCSMPAPAAGTWFVMLKGYSAYAGVTLKGTVY